MSSCKHRSWVSSALTPPPPPWYLTRVTAKREDTSFGSISKSKNGLRRSKPPVRRRPAGVRCCVRRYGCCCGARVSTLTCVLGPG
ncbi:hypothetical protein ES332_A10G257600v1 [Gossypium tomentosum]|uniref:Uncharacterized protein n=1 Tax=Gossypium tomentosum TaxID=34277 RepID=A0A5D2NWS2_GOSTO|nr:hypothetical protein ES332_A10G257600v1 [Gossypium tomentosum]